MTSTLAERTVTQAKILVVDDRVENLFAIKKTLESLDVVLFTAQSGNEALTLALHHDFALTLIDVQMPEMDGFELASLMHNNELTQHIPIIFLTAIIKDDLYISKGYATGAVDYLVKPIDPDIVQNKVRVFSELYLQRKALETEIEDHKQTQKKNEELLLDLKHRQPVHAAQGQDGRKGKVIADSMWRRLIANWIWLNRAAVDNNRINDLRLLSAGHLAKEVDQQGLLFLGQVLGCVD